ncbi:MAG: substrate-binding domain-containing protein, partial [Actinobacteria bacterium]|nr:substrate-binding domain-containing protein [Actinomycetota bacterium]
AFMLSGALGAGGIHPTPFYGEFIDGIQQEAWRQGVELTLATGLESTDRQIEYLGRKSDGGRVTGFLLATAFKPVVIDFLRESKLPVVFLGSHVLPVHGFSCVHGEDEHGSYLATRYLIEKGHRRIAFAGGCSEHEFYRLRLAGYCRAMLEASLEVDSALIWDGGPNVAFDGYLGETLSSSHPATAILCGTYHVAGAVLNQLKARQIKVPDEMSLICYDDMPFFRHTSPPLTCVKVVQKDIGRLALCRLLEMMENPDIPMAATSVPAKLVIRKSVAPPRRREGGTI